MLIPDIKAKIHKLPNSVKLGITGVCLVYMATAIFYAAVLPLKSDRGDSTRHIDYVYSVYHGKLADPHNYQLLLIDSSQRPKYTKHKGIDGVVRNGSAHTPPLHYVLMAIFAGKALDEGHWKEAVVIMRAVNILIGVACIFVLARAGWLIGGRYREYFAVAIPGFSIMVGSFFKVSANVYNDPLVTLLSTSLLVTVIASLKLGPSTKRNIFIILIGALGMLAKATFLPVLLLAMLFLVVAYAIHANNEDRTRAIIHATFVNTVLALVVILSSGWFYWRNYQLSGSFTRAFPKFALRGREENSLFSALFDPDFWGVIPEWLLGNTGFIEWKQSSLALFLLACVGFAVMATKFIKLQIAKNTILSKENIKLYSIACLVLLSVAGAYALQLQHRVGWGQLNMRYLLPGSMLAIGLFFSVASLAVRYFSKYVLTAMIALYSLAAVGQVVIYNTDYDVNFSGLVSALSDNGASFYLLPLLIVLLLVGLVFVFSSATDATDRLYKKENINIL